VIQIRGRESQLKIYGTADTTKKLCSKNLFFKVDKQEKVDNEELL